MEAAPATKATATAAIRARGRVVEAKDGTVVFAPANTNYEMRLACPNYAGPVGSYIEGLVRVKGRKVLTVPSGGNFISPIFGTPRIIQGRVRALDPQSVVVQAGAPVLVDLPGDDSAFDLTNGPISVGSLVNVTALPGAAFEWAGK